MPEEELTCECGHTEYWHIPREELNEGGVAIVDVGQCLSCACMELRPR